MKPLNIISAVLLVISVVACASRKPSPLNPLLVPYTSVLAERDETISLPAIGVRSEAEIGQSMVSTALRTTTSAIETFEDIVHKSETPEASGWLVLPKGKFYLSGENSDGKFYRSSKNGNLTRATSVPVVGGIFLPNQIGLTTKVFWFPQSNSYRPNADSHPAIRYEKTLVEIWGATSFKRELVYSGVSQNTISILYREFKDDMARPAFTQELKYDLTQSRSIGYKGARFEIERATNISITYKVLRSLD